MGGLAGGEGDLAVGRRAGVGLPGEGRRLEPAGWNVDRFLHHNHALDQSRHVPPFCAQGAADAGSGLGVWRRGRMGQSGTDRSYGPPAGSSRPVRASGGIGALPDQPLPLPLASLYPLQPASKLQRAPQLAPAPPGRPAQRRSALTRTDSPLPRPHVARNPPHGALARVLEPARRGLHLVSLGTEPTRQHGQGAARSAFSRGPMPPGPRRPRASVVYVYPVLPITTNRPSSTPGAGRQPAQDRLQLI